MRVCSGGARLLRKGASCCPAILPFLLTGVLHSQAGSLTLSPDAIRPTNPGVALIRLFLRNAFGMSSSSLQWRLEYPSSNVAGIVVEGGPALVASQKDVICADNGRTLTCLAFGLNAGEIPEGFVADLTVFLTTDATSASILLTDVEAASPNGDAISILAMNEDIADRKGSPTARRWVPLRRGPAGK